MKPISWDNPRATKRLLEGDADTQLHTAECAHRARMETCVRCIQRDMAKGGILTGPREAEFAFACRRMVMADALNLLDRLVRTVRQTSIKNLFRIVFISSMIDATNPTVSPARADEPEFSRFYSGQLETYDGERHQVYLVLDAQSTDTQAQTLTATGTEWYRVAKGYRPIPVRIVVETKSGQFTLTYLPAACDRAQETPATDQLVGIISRDFTLATNDYRDESRLGSTDFVFTAMQSKPPIDVELILRKYCH